MIDDETLMAFVDGALDEAAAQRIAEAIDTDPALAARAERLMQMGSLLRDSFAAPMQEPPPPHLADMIRAHKSQPTADVIDLAARRQEKQQQAPRETRPSSPQWKSPARMAALAAGLAALVLASLQFMPRSMPGGTDSNRELAQILDTTASMTIVNLADGRLVKPDFTFLTAEKRPCRQYRLRDSQGQSVVLACRLVNGRWEQMASAPSAARTDTGVDGYEAAAGDASPAIDSMRRQLGASDPLDRAQEADLIRHRWQTKKSGASRE